MTPSRAPGKLAPPRFPRPASSRRLIAWYRKHRRSLPWRKTGDPYRVWLSEVMLQQTQVATVIPYYRRFLERFPRLKDLAGASTEAVLSAWSGLGYYRRARNLHAAAREVMERFGGELPAEVPGLRSLPGVGIYTAGAVASIAFGLPEPALDGNAIRVLSRLLALRGDPGSRAGRKGIEGAARELLRGGAPGDVNQALMELGALICVPASPRCVRCPLKRDCGARALGIQSLLPETSPGRAPVSLQAAVAIIHRGRSYLMVRRSGEDLMRDLWEFPGGFLGPEEGARDALVRIGRERLGVALRPGRKVASLRQSLTYRRVELSAYRATLSEPLPRAGRSSPDVRWVRPADLAELPHGSATRRILHRIEAGSREKTTPGRSGGRR